MNIYRFLRPTLFAFSPEQAHVLTLKFLRTYGAIPTVSSQKQSPNFEIGGLQVSNRLGLAAGFDKDGVAIKGIAKLGFGFIELGAVTPQPQLGNPQPRLFRLTADEAIINRMGFNNQGVDALAKRIVKARKRVSIPIGVNLGKNLDTPLDCAVDDYVYGFERVGELVDFVTLNFSSPNTAELRRLQTPELAGPLLEAMVHKRELILKNSGNRISVLVKISPDLEETEISQLSQLIRDCGCDGIIATNTSVRRAGVSDTLYNEPGGLSGRPLFVQSKRCVEISRKAVGEKFLIIGCGGISKVEEANEMIDAGADLIQIYTAMVYQGPSCVKVIAQSITN